MQSKNGLFIHKKNLRKLVGDDRMQPSRRLLAEMLLLYLEGYIDNDLLMLAFGGQSKIKWNKGAEAPEVQPTTKTDLDTSRQVKEAYLDLQRMLSGGDNGESRTSTADAAAESSGASDSGN